MDFLSSREKLDWRVSHSVRRSLDIIKRLGDPFNMLKQNITQFVF